MSSQQKYRCPGPTCGYIYDPKRGDKKGKIPAGTPFEDLPDDWKCPLCGIGKRFFKPVE
jgi:rubredoxin